MRHLFILILYLTYAPGFGQGKADSILLGSLLINLKAADPSKYYKYDIDSVNYTLVKFNGKGIMTDHIFHWEYNESLIEVFSSSKSYDVYCLKNKNGSKMLNEIWIGKCKGTATHFGAHLDTLIYGHRYAYYYSKRISNVTYYNKLGINTGPSIKYDADGYKMVQEINDPKTGAAKKLIFYRRNGTVNYSTDKSENFKISEAHYKNGMIASIDSTANDNASVIHNGYYETGAKKEEYILRLNKIEGEALFYYPSGKLRLQEYYKRGEKTGEFILYNEDGTEKEKGKSKIE